LEDLWNRTTFGLSAAFFQLCRDDLRDCLWAGWNPIVGLERRFFSHLDASHAVVLVAIRSSDVMALDPLIGP